MTKAEKFPLAPPFDRRITSENFFLLARLNTKSNARLGLAVGKRVVSGAVDRNKIKRKIREAFRLRCSEFPGIDVIIKVSKFPRDTSQIEREVTTLFTRLR